MYSDISDVLFSLLSQFFSVFCSPISSWFLSESCFQLCNYACFDTWLQNSQFLEDENFSSTQKEMLLLGVNQRRSRFIAFQTKNLTLQILTSRPYTLYTQLERKILKEDLTQKIFFLHLQQCFTTFFLTILVLDSRTDYFRLLQLHCHLIFKLHPCLLMFGRVKK